jgi:hypothetical protein
MTYRVEEGALGRLEEVWELNYVNERDWTKTLLESPANPATVGSTERFLDATLTVTHLDTVDAATGAPFSFTTEHSDAPVAPSHWLLRELDIQYQERGYYKPEISSENRLGFEIISTAPCVEDVVDQPVSCSTSDTYTETETIIYSLETNPPLPIERTVVIDGDVVGNIEVLSLVLADGTELELDGVE